MNHWHLRQAAKCIRNGGVVAYPTETVYGLGCDPFNPNAVTRLLTLKQREWTKGLILVAADLEHVRQLIKVDDFDHLREQVTRETQIVSWIIPAQPNLPLLIRGVHGSVAIRISRHPLIVELCGILQQPIVSTSANPSRQHPATNAMQIRRYFDQQLDYIIHSAHPCKASPSQLLRYPSRQRLR